MPIDADDSCLTRRLHRNEFNSALMRVAATWRSAESAEAATALVEALLAIHGGDRDAAFVWLDRSEKAMQEAWSQAQIRLVLSSAGAARM